MSVAGINYPMQKLLRMLGSSPKKLETFSGKNNQKVQTFSSELMKNIGFSRNAAPSTAVCADRLKKSVVGHALGLCNDQLQVQSGGTAFTHFWELP